MSESPPFPRAGARCTRRAFLSSGALGLGALAAGELLAPRARAASKAQGGPLATGLARAKHVIFLAMSGAPPQHDFLDPKPELQRLDGTPAPERFFANRRLAFIKGHPTLLGSPYTTRRAGRSGLEVTSAMPHFAGIADKVTIVRSLRTSEFNHAPADLLLYAGNRQVGGAAMGAWATYGLGSDSDDLPGFVVMVSGGSDPTGGKATWSSGYLPPQFQGVRLRSSGEPILYVGDPPGLSRAGRRSSLDALAELNRIELEESGDPETRARIDQFELAFRMQAAVPELAELASEPAAVIEEYGAVPGAGSFANNCLLARRLVERGVRWVQVHDWGWDIHGTGAGDDLMSAYPAKCRSVDRAAAALVTDLDRRGLLDETLVVWGGEFGRTPMNEARGGARHLGRDHHPDCFSYWLAGAGIRRGHVHGETCELGHDIVRDPVDVRDLQATILAALGLDPFTFRYPYQGLDQRLIGVEEGPRVVHELFA